MLLRCAVAPGFPVAQDPGLSRSARPAHEAPARTASRPHHCHARANAAPAADLLIDTATRQSRAIPSGSHAFLVHRSVATCTCRRWLMAVRRPSWRRGRSAH